MIKKKIENQNNKEKNKQKGITLVALVVTIIVLVILAGVAINLVLGQNGIIGRAKQASEETTKEAATEKINLKITSVQIEEYAKTQTMPTLKKLAEVLKKDEEIAYVTETSKVAAVEYNVTSENPSSIFTRLKEYPHEFEINSSLQLASIDGVKIATVPSNDDDTIVSMTKGELKGLIASEVSSQIEESINTLQQEVEKIKVNTVKYIDYSKEPIATITQYGKSYTAEEECIAVYSIKTSGNTPIIYVNGKVELLASLYDDSGWIPLKAGDTISTRDNNVGQTYDIKIYPTVK